MRGDVVILDYPYTDGGGAKVRPALIVQDDRHRSVNTIIAQVTTNLRNLGPTRVLIDPTTPDGSPSGLRAPSVVACDMLFTIHQDQILRVIGHATPAIMAKVDDALKIVLGLP